MPAFAGYHLESFPIWTQDHLNMVPLDQLWDYLYEDRKSSSTPEGMYGPLTRNEPVETYSRSVQGVQGHAYYHDFYFRVHVTPAVIDLGNMLSSQTRPVEVWNAWPESKLLSDITETNTDGITLVEPQPVPTTFGQLEVRTYQANISSNGSPIIDAAYNFVFPDESPRLAIIGRRVVVWPFIPQTRFRERLEWMTDVMQAYSAEQRLALRAAPRQSLRYEYQLDPTQFSRAKALSFAWSHRVYGAGVWAEATRLGPVASGVQLLNFSTANADYRANDLILLWESDTKFLAVETTTLTPTAVGLKQPLELSFANAYVMPLRFARTLQGSDFVRSDGNITLARLEFLVSNSVDLAVGYATPFPQYRGADVLTDQSVVLGDMSERAVRRVDVFDNGSGPIVTDPERGYLERTETVTFDPLTRPDVWATRRWLHSRRGKQKSFWLPSWNTDLVLANNVNSADTIISVRPIGYPLYYGVTDIMVQLTSGARIFKRVLNGSDDVSGNEILALETAFGTSITVAEVAFISFIRHVRLDTDSLELSHTYGGHVSISAPVIEVPEGA